MPECDVIIIIMRQFYATEDAFCIQNYTVKGKVLLQNLINRGVEIVLKTLFKIRVLRTQTQRMKTLQNGGQISFQYITAGLSEPEKIGHTSRLEHQMLCLYSVSKGFDFEDQNRRKAHRTQLKLSHCDKS